MVRNSAAAQAMVALTPDPIGCPYEPVHSGENHAIDRLEISDKTNIGLQFHQSLSAEIRTLDYVANPHQQTVRTELALSGSPLLDWQLVFSSPAVCTTSLDLRRPAWFEQAPRNERSYIKRSQPMKPFSPLILGRHLAESSSIDSSTTRTTDSHYASFSPNDTTSLLVDHSCPPPPRASMMMDPLSQGLLDKKLRKMGGWKSKLLNFHSPTETHPRRSVIERVLGFVRDDLMLRRGQSVKVSYSSSNEVVAPPIMDPVSGRFTK
ncbi:unnamed protein product [Rhizoctonia solani]|uniref:Uncharacterized protein n=1 Tax=Rhizoctonia solani TaxID=456999 RepID=A0A8H2XUY6_9AGAM|nr:unnamed protein product [Rhizoctonia solani]CAE6435211.1 unnamed protein product [Rhizoctonia solani]